MPFALEVQVSRDRSRCSDWTSLPISRSRNLQLPVCRPRSAIHNAITFTCNLPAESLGRSSKRIDPRNSVSSGEAYSVRHCCLRLKDGLEVDLRPAEQCHEYRGCGTAKGLYRIGVSSHTRLILLTVSSSSRPHLERCPIKVLHCTAATCSAKLFATPQHSTSP